MSPRGRIWLGADPGGRAAFGVATVQGSFVTSDCVSSVDEAVAFFRSVLRAAPPSGVGIDAPLWWSSAPSGARKVDGLLRNRYGLSGGAVQQPNSLRGAAVLQAAMLIERLREVYPDLRVTETHPKALLKGVYRGTLRHFKQKVGLQTLPSIEHERDAVIGAVAAREGFSGKWRHDLSLNRFPEEQDPKSYWLGPVSYVWPEPL